MTIQRFVAAALIAAAAPCAANAQTCPERADLEQGRVITLAGNPDGVIHEYRQQPGGVAVVTLSPFNDQMLRQTFQYDHPLALPTLGGGVNVRFD